MDVELRERPPDVGHVLEVVRLREDEHRGFERLGAVGPGLVDERLRIVGIEDVVVAVDPVPVQEVLFAGEAVTDRDEAVGLRGLVVAPLRQDVDRVDEQLLGARLLVGGHAFDTAEVDLGRVDEPVGRQRHRFRRLRGLFHVVLGAAITAVAVLHVLHVMVHRHFAVVHAFHLVLLRVLVERRRGVVAALARVVVVARAATAREHQRPDGKKDGETLLHAV